jgi:hypothetical protein
VGQFVIVAFLATTASGTLSAFEPTASGILALESQERQETNRPMFRCRFQDRGIGNQTNGANEFSRGALIRTVDPVV